MAEPPVDSKLEIDESDIIELEIVKPSQHVIVNTANYFFTSEKYKVHNELINWCQVEAVKAGFTIVSLLLRNQITVMGEGNIFLLGCERGDVYKEVKIKLKKEDTSTRKCECPFWLRGYFLASRE
jgi:hypothetical protein